MFFGGVCDAEFCRRQQSRAEPPALLRPEPLAGRALGRALDWAVEAGLTTDTATDRDLLDTRLMGSLTPRPSWTTERFEALRAASPEAATDWFYVVGDHDNDIKQEPETRRRRPVAGSALSYWPDTDSRLSSSFSIESEALSRE